MSLDRTYSALAHASRRQMVRRLAGSSAGLSVTSLAAQVPGTLPAVMKHLDVLAAAGLIERRKAGRTVTVTLTPAPIGEASDWLQVTSDFWSSSLDRLAALAEEDTMESVIMTRRIEAPPAVVFATFVDPARVAEWWGPGSGPVIEARMEARLGGTFHVRFAGEDGEEYGSHGAFEEFDPPVRLALSWTWDDAPGVQSRVEVTLRPVDGGTELTLVHRGLPDAEDREAHHAGWTVALTKLGAIAEANRDVDGEG